MSGTESDNNHSASDLGEESSHEDIPVNNSDEKNSEPVDVDASTVTAASETPLQESEETFVASQGAHVDVEVVTRVKNYLLEVEAETVNVDIEVSSLKRKSMRLSKTVVYQLNVKIDESETIVWREYEEFVLLVKYLGMRFKNAVVPPLPSSFARLQTVTDAMQEKRLDGLRLFMASLLRHPFLRRDKMVTEFLKSTGALSKKIMEGLLKESSEGYSRWCDMISITATPEKPLTLLKSLQGELSALTSFYSSLLKESRSLCSKLKSYGGTLQHFNSSIEQWYNVERADLCHLSGNVSIRTEASVIDNTLLSECLQKMSAANQTDYERVIECSKDTLDILKEPLKYELHILESMSKDVDRVKEYVAKYNKATKGLKEQQLEEFKHAQQQEISNGDHLSKKMATAQKAVEDTKHELDFFARGLLIAEMSRFRFERGSRSANILLQLGKVKATLASTEAEMWTKFSTTLPSETLTTAPEMIHVNELLNVAVSPKKLSQEQ